MEFRNNATGREIRGAGIPLIRAWRATQVREEESTHRSSGIIYSCLSTVLQCES